MNRRDRKQRVHTTGVGHPKNHYCGTCNAVPGAWCVTKGGLILNGFEKQHANRKERADIARGGLMIGGKFIPSVRLANGAWVPVMCIEALQGLNRRWPGAALPQAHGAISAAVILAYEEALR